MKDRKAFGQSISKFQALRHSVAQMASEIEVCKTFNYTTVKRLDNDEYVVKEATMAKLTSTKMADDVIYQCLQLLGRLWLYGGLSIGKDCLEIAV